MKRILAVASAALMTFATMGIATVPASAQHWGHHGGGGWHHGGWHHGGWHRGHGRYYGGLGAGILGGLIVGGALAGPSYYGCGYYGCDPYAYGPYYGPRVVYRPRAIYRSRGRLGAAHVQWCYDRYRSYRASDNTYQPYHGPRRQCYSPYG